MITPTHVVVNGLLATQRDRSKHADPEQARTFVLGGLAPDIGLYLLSAGAAVWYPLVQGWSVERTFRHVFDDLFFNNAVWVAVQNVLHAPLVVAALYLLGRRGGQRWHRLLRGFAAGCAVHIALDVPTHHNDGPLVFFPFDWTTRFSSPISYWDPEHFGNIVQPIDLAITLLGGAWLARRWWQRRQGQRASTVVAP